MKRLSTLLFAMTVWSLSTLYGAPIDLAPAGINDVNNLFTLLGAKPDRQNLQFLKGKAPSSSLTSPVSALASVILYKADPRKYEEQLYQAFSVHDYSQRSHGNYNLISREEMLSDVQNIENQYKGKISDGRASLLFSFCLYRDQNKWVLKDGQKISLARFFRTAFLASALKGTGIDVVGLANKIDRRAEAEDLKR